VIEHDRPTVSVIVPVFNRLSLLRQTVASLEAQTLASAEFILVDDRSEPDVLQFLESLPAKDSRFRIIQKPIAMRQGCQTSRNIGIEASIADFIMFMDSDDLLAPRCLEDRYEALVERPSVDLLIGRQACFSANDRRIHWINIPKPERADLDRFLDLTHPIDVPWVNGAALIRKASIVRAGIRYRAEFDWEDVAFHFECLANGLSIERMPFPGDVDSFYRIHDDGASMGRGLFAVDGMRSAAEMIGWMCDSLERAGEFNESRRRALSASLFQACILRSIDADEFSLAANLIRASGKSRPLARRDQNRIELYRAGRLSLQRFPRLRYYWDRLSRRIIIPDMFPSGASTYGTVVSESSEAPAILSRLLDSAS
jgi:glycosyltransferase involved in cell wall biosynthesis